VSPLEIIEESATTVGLVISFAAAFFWWLASLTKIPPFPDVGWNSDWRVFEPVRTALQTVSRRNAIAAFLPGVAALAFAIAFGSHQLSKWI
jgi:hypothetical protein